MVIATPRCRQDQRVPDGPILPAVRLGRPVLTPIPSTTATCRVIAPKVATSMRPMTSPMSVNLTVCGQSVITWDAAHSPFS